MDESPTSRSLRYCRDKTTWIAGVVERWLPIPKHPAGGQRKDLFGFIDIIAVTDDPGCLGIQATSTSNMSARLTKAKVACGDDLKTWLRAGNRFEVWGWAKRGSVGKRELWTLRRIEIIFDAEIGFVEQETPV